MTPLTFTPLPNYSGEHAPEIESQRVVGPSRSHRPRPSKKLVYSLLSYRSPTHAQPRVSVNTDAPLPLAKSSEFMNTLLQAKQIKQPQPRQRGYFNLDDLYSAFPKRLGLRSLLGGILSSKWYLSDEMEPFLNEPRAWVLLTDVCRKAADDTEFLSAVMNASNLPENERSKMSIYSFFGSQKDGRCLFCNTLIGRKGMFLAHVRNHIEHRPFECRDSPRCEICEGKDQYGCDSNLSTHFIDIT